MSKFTYQTQLDDFKNTAYWLAKRGWSEGSGGNLSVRLDAPMALHEDDHIPLPFAMPYLAGKAILLTGSGTRARAIGENPDPHVGLYKISDDGTCYGWIAGNRKPSIELPAHCAIHNVLEEFRPEDKAVMHTHPANLIALCHLPELTSAKGVSDKILRLQSEARLHLPEGIGYVPHQLPGTLELGIRSAKLVEKHRLVLWHMHGCLATGADLATAFDYMEVFEKCARIYWTLRAAGTDPKGMSDAEVEKTLKAFGVFDRYQ